jgi:hypothetical protein
MTACTILQTSPYPVYEIDLGKLNTPIEISAIVKSFGTVKYVYTFVYFDEIIKHGISVDEKSIFGERIYRQAGHLLGWPKQLAPGSAGDDMRYIADRYFINNGKSLNRQGMKIVVRDLTNVESASVTDKNLHVKQLERQLIKEYKDMHNTLPIGNVKDEAYIDNKTCVTKSTWDRLFEFEEGV